jgi:NADH:ubiquinone oxidoreductase subunit F (NADH-binding)
MNINVEARRLNAVLGGGRGAPILKARSIQAELDRSAWEAIERYAGENGLTVDEVKQMWQRERKQQRHTRIGGMVWHSNGS